MNDDMTTPEELADRLANKILEELCYRLDIDLYIPMKKELEGRGTHTLGFKKEAFKGTMERVVRGLIKEELVGK